ncbi:DUF2716 domain-containing protein [Actinoplanes sp. NPDC051851]|uniref:DUF2716 domain-containing protein n=1 Tax=Actinoplanes sp. NPDC051851 TaxID=3154753 RepID=UPI0034271E46
MEISPAQRRLLSSGVREWLLPTRRPEGARLLGTGDVPAWARRVADALDAGEDLPAADWPRALLATELAFASSSLGFAIDWPDDTGYPDLAAIRVLREIQEQFHYDRPPATPHEPAWTPMPDGEDDEIWRRFQARFAFRPGMRSFPAIDEPTPSVTFDLAAIHQRPARSTAAHDARTDLLNASALTAFTEILPDGTRLAALDWQHRCYWFRPDVQARSGGPWRLSPCPDGDYYVFLTEDLTCGTFGHPWEQTLCIFGEPLVTALTPLLAPWLPIKRSSPPSQERAVHSSASSP